jgi:hypothetical protein
MITIKKDTSTEGYNWLVWDSKNKSGDLVNSFSIALRVWLWRIGLPSRIAFFESKVFSRRAKS